MCHLGPELYRGRVCGWIQVVSRGPATASTASGGTLANWTRPKKLVRRSSTEGGRDRNCFGQVADRKAGGPKFPTWRCRAPIVSVRPLRSFAPPIRRRESNMSIIELTVQQSERGQTFEELIDVVAELKGELGVKGQSKGDREGRTQTG
jgi:hypothetical protein